MIEIWPEEFVVVTGQDLNHSEVGQMEMPEVFSVPMRRTEIDGGQIIVIATKKITFLSKVLVVESKYFQNFYIKCNFEI